MSVDHQCARCGDAGHEAEDCKPPEALRLADALDDDWHNHGSCRRVLEAAALLRAQNAAIERKDALLRQALEAMRLAVDDDYLLAAVRSMVAITKELQ